VREIVICHAREDRADAAELAAFVRAGTRLPVRLEDGEIRPGSTLLSTVEEWTTGGGVLAVLTPRSAPEGWRRPEWERILIADPRESGTPIGLVLTAGCKFPEQLRRERTFFDLTQNRLHGFRLIKRWLLGLETAREPLSGPGRPGGFGGG
jgi:TIR domain